MRLIDADELQNGLDRLMDQGELSYNIFKAAVDILDIQPTAYDVDKVVERLEVNSMFAQADDEPFIVFDDAVEIVKSGGIE